MMSGLQTVVVEVPFKKGVDTKTNAKLVLPGSLLVLENGVFVEASTIKKRNGYVALANDVLAAVATKITTGDALATFDNELLLMAAGEVYSWSKGLAKWVDRGFCPPVAVKARSILRNTYNQSTPDAASVNGISVYAWVDGRGGVRGSIVDDTTGAILLGDQLLDAAGVRPRCIAVQQSLLVIYQSAANIVCRVVDSTNPSAFGAGVNLATDGHATPANQHLDVCPSGYGSGAGTGIGAAFFAYNTNATAIKMGYVLATGVVGQTSNGYPNVVSVAEAADKSLAILTRGSTGEFWVLYTNGTAAQGVRFTTRYADLTQKTAITSVEVLLTAQNVTGGFDSSGNLQFFYEVNAALNYNTFVKKAQVTPAGAVSGVAVYLRSVGLAGKGFVHSTGVYVVVVHDPSPSATVQGLQNTYFVTRSDGVIAAKLQPSTADRLQANQIPSVRQVDANNFAFVAPVRTQFVTSGSGTQTATISYSLVGLANIVLTFGGEAYRSAQLGESLLMAGGALGCYDGQGVVENGFHLYPENLSEVAAAGGAMAAGTYQYCVVWEWIDAMGQTHRSAPSVARSITVTINQKVTVTIPTLRLTAKQGTRTALRAEVYWTTAGGTVFYKTPNDPATDPTASPLYNDPTVDTISFVRSVADASITANQILYTQGGILNNVAPPAARLIAVSKNRAFLAGLEDVRRVWFSKNYVRTEGVAFQDTFFFDVDPSGGELVQIAVMDEKVILLKQYQIEMIQGDGPDDQGANSSFINPVVLTTDAGCIDPDSVAVTPNGIVFKSAKGIYLLTRGLEAVYIGDRVEAFNATHVIGATLDVDRSEVRFLLADGKNALVWNYYFNEWSVFTNHGGVDSVIWGGAFIYLKSSGLVMQETPGLYTDNGVDIHMRLKMGWLHLSLLQGFQRVRRATFLGDFYSAHTLRVRIAYDYQPFSVDQKVFIPGNVLQSSTFGSDATFGASTPFGGAGADLVNQWQIHMPRQKCQAVQFEIEDIGSSPGQAYSLSGLALEIAQLPGSARLPPAKSM